MVAHDAYNRPPCSHSAEDTKKLMCDMSVICFTGNYFVMILELNIQGLLFRMTISDREFFFTNDSIREMAIFKVFTDPKIVLK